MINNQDSPENNRYQNSNTGVGHITKKDSTKKRLSKKEEKSLTDKKNLKPQSRLKMICLCSFIALFLIAIAVKGFGFYKQR